MGAEAQLRRLGGKAKKNSPPILSHEFVIQNHADIMSCVAMLFVAGLMFKATAPLCSAFVALQHNVTGDIEDPKIPWLYTYGWKDAANIFFYTLICIVGHAVLQEYVLDKLKGRVHLSKTKTAKFSESGQLAVFYLASAGFAIYVLTQANFATHISFLWDDYPKSHSEVPFLLKLFFIIQISYWIHNFPEFYFQKVRREDIHSRALYSTLYLVFISAAYVLNFTRVALCMLALHYAAEVIYHVARIIHFAEKPTIAKPLWRIWNIAFVTVRFGCVILAFLTFWYGLRLSEQPRINVATGNFNTAVVRLNSLLAVCGVQAWLMWNFICAWLRRARQHAPAAKKRYDLRNQPKKARKQEDDFRSLPEADQHNMRQLRARKSQEQKE